MGKKGRPKSDVTKERIVTIRMSDAEYRTLKEYSDKHQQTITETIKSGINLLYFNTENRDRYPQGSSGEESASGTGGN